MFSSSVLAGKMRMCKAKNGHTTFTQTRCPENTSRKNIYVPPAQAPISALRPGEVNELNRIQQNKFARQQQGDMGSTQQKQQSNSTAAAIRSEKQKARQIREIERKMRLGAVSKRRGHGAISRILASGSPSKKQKQRHVREIEKDMRRNAISQPSGHRIINDIQTGKATTSYKRSASPVQAHAKSPSKTKNAFDPTTGKNYKVTTFKGSPTKVRSTDGTEFYNTGVKGSEDKARLPDGRTLKLK